METTSPTPAEPQKAPEAANSNSPAKPAKGAKTKKKPGFLKGCLLFVLVLVLLAAGFVANALGLPQKLGLVKSATEKRYDVQASDRTAAADLVAELETKGIATKGMEVYVLPLKDGSGSGAYVVLDVAAGFGFNASGEGDPFLGTLATLAKSEAVKAGGVKNVAFEYRDDKGRTLITIGASVQDGADFADGKMTQEQFMAKVGGKADLKNVSAAIQEILQQ